MKEYNIFTWLIDFSNKPKLFKIWIYIVAPVMFVMWLCVQFVFKQLLPYWASYVLIPLVCFDLIWDCGNYIWCVMCNHMPKIKSNR